MAKYLFIFIPLILTSCILWYDKMNIKSNQTYTRSSELKMNGYYLGKVLDTNNDSAFQVIFFYRDGSVHITPVYYDSLQIQKDLVNYPKSFNQVWGFYQITRNDTIAIETIWQDIPSFRAYKDTMTGICYQNQIKFIDSNNQFTFHFVPFNIKPDSTMNWLKSHRKYQ